MSVIANLDYGEVQDILSGMAEHPKLKRGRPTGSKNNNHKTLPKESVSTTEPKKPGPKIGSKNKKTLLKESVSTTEPKKRERGRPTDVVGRCSLCGETGHNKRTCLSCTDLPNSTK